MQSFKAVVRNGRLVVDEPTDLPEGTEVQLLGVGPVTLTDMERAIAEGAARRGSV